MVFIACCAAMLSSDTSLAAIVETTAVQSVQVSQAARASRAEVKKKKTLSIRVMRKEHKRENWREKVSLDARARKVEVNRKKTFIKIFFTTLSLYHHYVIEGKRMDDTLILCSVD